jgi:tRNA (guanine37-N1)-methyltransferase
MRIDVVTLFPAMVAGPIGESMLRVAQDRGAVDIRVVDLRDHTEGRHRVADDYPFGGGGGMILKPEPLFRAVEALRGPDGRVVLLCPQGPTFNQATAARLAGLPHLVLVCGHYEGVDERVREHLVDEEISIGDYVLTGVLGDPAGPSQDSFAGGRLDYPQYTRPAEFRGHGVPDVLLSGDHQRIARWRRKEALRRTLERRPDLLAVAPPTDDERHWLAELRSQDVVREPGRQP